MDAYIGPAHRIGVTVITQRNKEVEEKDEDKGNCPEAKERAIRVCSS